MKFSGLIFLVFFSTLNLFGQNLMKGLTLLEKGRYEEAKTIFLENTTISAESIRKYGLVYIDFETYNEETDLAQLLQNIYDALYEYKNLKSDLKNFYKPKFSLEVMNDLKQKIENKTFDVIMLKSNIKLADKCLTLFKNEQRSQDFINRLNNSYEQLKYQEAVLNNTTYGYTSFIYKYPNSNYRNEVKNRREKLEYDKIKYSEFWRSFKEFSINFPDGKYKDSALIMVEKILYDNALKNEKYQYYFEYFKYSRTREWSTEFYVRSIKLKMYKYIVPLHRDDCSDFFYDNYSEKYKDLYVFLNIFKDNHSSINDKKYESLSTVFDIIYKRPLTQENFDALNAIGCIMRMLDRKDILSSVAIDLIKTSLTSKIYEKNYFDSKDPLIYEFKTALLDLIDDNKQVYLKGNTRSIFIESTFKQNLNELLKFESNPDLKNRIGIMLANTPD